MTISPAMVPIKVDSDCGFRRSQNFVKACHGLWRLAAEAIGSLSQRCNDASIPFDGTDIGGGRIADVLFDGRRFFILA